MLVTIALALLSFTTQSLAADNGRRTIIEGKLWYVASTQDGNGKGILGGAHFTTDLNDSYWLSGMILGGTITFDDWDREHKEIDTQLMLGRSFEIGSIALGGRYNKPEYENAAGGISEDDILGMFVYLEFDGSLGDKPFGWYTSGSLTPVVTTSDGLQAHAEAGISYKNNSITSTLGYRLKNFGGDRYWNYNGVTASVVFAL